MHLIRKINAVTGVLREADNHIANFQRQTNISCVSKCNLCCIKPDIETTIVEFLPNAYKLYLSGEYNTILERIDKKTDTTCVFYNPFINEGACSQYATRGLLCRLFGFSAKTDKTGAKILVTCNPIKQEIDFNIPPKILNYAPEMSDYYMKLYGIDTNLTVQYYPINQSIKKALEIVLLHFQYKKKPA